MRQLRWLLAIPAVVLSAAACSGKEQPKLDDALSRDLSLAATVQPSAPQQFVSPAELPTQGYPRYPQQGYAPAYAPAPAVRQVPTVYRPSAPRPAPRATTASSAPAGAVAQQPSQPVRHTKRDALIGVAAGTIAGAAIGKDTKGALVGAAAGGLLGAIVGHTIDVDRP
jgi:hypothetical protein